MKGVFYLKNINELESMSFDQEKCDLIISPKCLSRLGELSIDEANTAIDFCHENGVAALLEWDILMTDDEFSVCVDSLNKLHLNNITAIRVQDIGAYHYLINRNILDIHLIIESGNHNLVAIKKWQEIGSARLKRFVLGLELPKKTVRRYTELLDTPCELQVLGKILLFYSPRSLLSRPLDSNAATLHTHASSEETPHKGFFVIENNHGTFMFLPKDQFLLDIYEDVIETGVEFLRLDHRFLEGDFTLSDMVHLFVERSEEGWVKFKENYSNKFIRGYFNVNKSDAIFPKLKNYRTIKKPDSYVGKVVDVKKEQYLAVSIFHHFEKCLKVGDLIEISSPDGKVKKIEVRSIKNMALENISEVKDEKIVLIPHVGGISVKAQIHFCSL